MTRYKADLRGKCDNCRNADIKYDTRARTGSGGRRLEEKHKLNYRFHDPNDPELLAGTLLQIFVEVNADKVEHALRAELDANDGYAPTESINSS